MSLSLLAPYALKQFQLDFGDYLRTQRQSSTDTVPNRVGKIYQDLIFNNVSGFLNSCFPICKQILADDWKKLCLYFFQRYPAHSPYFTEIPMQFVEFLSMIHDEQVNLNPVLDIKPAEIDFIPDYLAELAHYEWLELYVDTLPNQENRLILNDGQAYFLNHTIQNYHYAYPVHHISVEDTESIVPNDTFLVVLRKDDEIKFVEINILTHLLLDFMQHQQKVYQSKRELMLEFSQHIEYADAEGLLNFADDLFLMLQSENILWVDE